MTLLEETGRTSAALTEDLLRRLATGKKDALAEVYLQTRAAVYGFSLSIVKNPADAEDVLQDTYLQIYSAAKSYSPRGKAIAMEAAGATESEVYDLDVDFDYELGVLVYEVDFELGRTEYDDNIWEYHVEFHLGSTEYEYEISATDGAILDFEKDTDD